MSLFDDAVRWIHLIAAATWVGGLITVAALVPALRRAGVEREALQAMARQFGAVLWTAMGFSVVTGIIQVSRLDVALSDDTAFAFRLFIKLLLVGTAVALALLHQMTAAGTTPARRGAIQGAILVVSLGVVAAAVSL